jgi:predicted GIY-YIG superfamily endonuclease
VFVYILLCADGSFYVGHTCNLIAREQTHNEGKGGRDTSIRRPVEIVYAEEWPTDAAALDRERQLKRWSAKKKEALIAGSLDRLHLLSRRH